MELKEAVLGRRTRRKFLDKTVSPEALKTLIEYARYAPMGANLQGIKYMLVEDKQLAEEIFPHTKWSGYHPENAPHKEEMPPSYIAMLGDTEIKKGNFETDAGAAGTVICLAAEDMGLSTCWLGAINREKVSELLGVEDRYKLLYLIAVGYSEQKVKAVPFVDDIKYFTDEDGVLTVPKRKTEDLILPINGGKENV